MNNPTGLEDLMEETSGFSTEELSGNPPAPLVLEGPVPNIFPTVETNYRIAIVGEAPGKDEITVGQPFVGMAGKLLTGLLGKAGILRAGCFIGNVCQYKPIGNVFDTLPPEKIEAGLKQLADDLARFNPNICVLLGAKPLFYAKGVKGIFDWRGSFFIGEAAGPFFGRKCIASLHPAYCLRDYTGVPLLRFDLAKASKEGSFPELTLPVRELTINLTCDEIINRLETIKQTGTTISIDIEGGVDSMSCISIADTPTSSFIVPFSKFNGESFWNEDEECRIWKALSEMLADTRVGKILQNSLYDRFVLQYSYDCIVRNTVEDTMVKSWEKYCELEKSLGFLCSLYTRQPYYKSDRKSDDIETFWRYCCMDSAVTYEIADKLTPMLDDRQKKHYQLYIKLLNLFLYIELKGFSYDVAEAKRRLETIHNHIYTLQADMDKLAGVGVSGKEPRQELLNKVRDVMCYKRNISQPKKEYEEEYPAVVKLLNQIGELSARDVGYINSVCGWSMNVKSKVLKDWFYKTLKFPPQYKTDPKTKVKRLTTDFEATLKLMKLTNRHPAVELLLTIQIHRTRAQMLSIQPSKDGRMRENLNIVGSETGRVTSSRSSDYNAGKRVGTNMQTVSDDWDISEEGMELVAEGLRTLYVANPGHYIFQCDLRGSDGWTIGAHMAALGDPTMLEDLKFGLKPAQIVAYILRHGYSKLARASRPEIKQLVSEIKKEDWEYFVSKQGIWGTSYTMGPIKLAEVVLEESWGKMQLSISDARKFQAAILQRYNLRLWHNHCQKLIDKQGIPELVSAVGHKRKFFGRKTEILGKWLAHEPQIITTWATNLAAWRLWTDIENRVGNKLRIEPLHQVHDALIGQFKTEDTEWAIKKIRNWFANEIIIAGIPITIPFEGNYGTSWGDLSKGTI